MLNAKKKKYFLGIDQGTTGTTTLILDEDWNIHSQGYLEHTQYYPKPGWVEHDALEIWEKVKESVSIALAKGGLRIDDIAALGLDNQGETVVVWDKNTGIPIYNAIVWQDRRTAKEADTLNESWGNIIKEKTGVVVDAYFSALKIKWILDNVDGAREKVPIAGSVVDQQAALFGQACFNPGNVKTTYGTGCFMLMNTGDKIVDSRNGLLTTVAWGLNGKTSFALDGGVYITGAAVQWLRDGIKIINSAAETEELAKSVPDTGGLYFVPAFVGLAAPYWDQYARGMMIGITGSTTRAHIVRATLESIAYQVKENLDVMRKDSGIDIQVMRVDGGAVVNEFLMQFQADILGIPVDVPVITETTALGAAYLAALAVGEFESLEEIAKKWKLWKRYEPKMSEDERNTLMENWRAAVERARNWAKE